MRLLLTLVLTCLCASTAWARFEHHVGEAFDAEGRLLYRESHWLHYVDDTIRERRVLYACPDGRAFARKRVDYRSSAFAPEFELIDRRLSYREGLRRTTDGSLMVFLQRVGQTELEQATVTPSADLIADAGFDQFLAVNWASLLAGESVAFQFLVPGELGSLAFKVRAMRSTDPRQVTIRLSLGAWWGFLAPHIDATYERDSRRLLRYRGLSNLRDGDGNNYQVDIRFGQAPSVVDARAFDAARIQELVTTCAELRATSPR